MRLQVSIEIFMGFTLALLFALSSLALMASLYANAYHSASVLSSYARAASSYTNEIEQACDCIFTK